LVDQIILAVINVKVTGAALRRVLPVGVLDALAKR